MTRPITAITGTPVVLRTMIMNHKVNKDVKEGVKAEVRMKESVEVNVAKKGCMTRNLGPAKMGMMCRKMHRKPATESRSSRQRCRAGV